MQLLPLTWSKSLAPICVKALPIFLSLFNRSGPRLISEVNSSMLPLYCKFSLPEQKIRPLSNSSVSHIFHRNSCNSPTKSPGAAFDDRVLHGLLSSICSIWDVVPWEASLMKLDLIQHTAGIYHDWRVVTDSILAVSCAVRVGIFEEPISKGEYVIEDSWVSILSY